MTTDTLRLQGKRADLLRMDEHHAKPLLEAAQEMASWSLYLKPLQTLTDVQHFIGKAKQEEAAGTCIPYVIWDHTGQKIVGSTRLFDLSAEHHSLEIGSTWLNPAVWRTRINTECKYLLLREAFEHLDMLRVQIKTDLRNLQSQTAIARIGAVKEGILRKHRILHDGYVRDTVMYSITNEEWPGVKAKLESMLEQQ
ncbi:GNAT family N-acetyltransferase [Paenibacillus radicis (ex Gao et al. 2016)]|uniref:N-acetyltransferase n=1 Tax=Paenibacillus radicis (ex Gao et al. 2016) TaxID=1737354 RepID=A0A917LZ71_9BACL|nr:GNAT family protein [Paenibacillus radicis (ex Gao et al. 2016)]GGG65267.1 N-acetyltransferase [Paenibacillus radicis (ex Gao et al. 2016)]